MILDEELSSWHLACHKAEGNGEDLPPRPPHLVDYLSQSDWSTITKFDIPPPTEDGQPTLADTQEPTQFTLSQAELS